MAITSLSLAQASAGGMAGLVQFLPMVGIFVVMYFIMIRPQMKRQKELKTMIEALGKGDEVVLGGGLIGRITKVSESILFVEIAKDVEVQVQRHTVVQVLPKGSMK